ncbi:hypothetical protein B0A49_12002 [Cryomyces minteri]|uniref:Uncharacterized protein n=1 Tax=Cryomyces minteri TaxID=331657 RepID=A0A4U0WKT6_9PEZI|nr:hypothetical protein B0A49_12002 [Cryomyces minteri]
MSARPVFKKYKAMVSQPSRFAAVRQPPKRAASPELGDEDFDIVYNKRTGRPIRKGAGRKSLDPEYLDSTELVLGDSGDERSNDEEELPMNEHTGAKTPKLRKRKRTPSPTPTPLSPVRYDDVFAREISPALQGLESGAKAPSISLTINFPSEHRGPLVVNLDVAKLISQYRKQQNANSAVAKELTDSSYSTSTSKVAKRVVGKTTSPVQTTKVGFLSLPGELRNHIYRILFVDEYPFNISKPDNFCRSGSLLSTCRQVYLEGRTVLYSENKFIFERQIRTRAIYYQPQWIEVGFKDVRRFLTNIGPANIALIRDLSLCFGDTMPSGSPHLKTAEQRRYVHDEHVLECLKMLGRSSQLKKISLHFYGKKFLATTDYRFLERLKCIKADDVQVSSDPRTIFWQIKVHPNIKSVLIKEMTREERMFPVDPVVVNESTDTEEEDPSDDDYMF